MVNRTNSAFELISINANVVCVGIVFEIYVVVVVFKRRSPREKCWEPLLWSTKQQLIEKNISDDY